MNEIKGKNLKISGLYEMILLEGYGDQVFIQEFYMEM